MSSTPKSKLARAPARAKANVSKPHLPKAQKPLFSPPDASGVAPAAISMAGSRYMAVGGDFNGKLRIKLRGPLFDVIADQSTAQPLVGTTVGALAGNVSIDGSTNEFQAFYAAALNPWACPFYAPLSGGTTWNTGVAFPSTHTLIQIAQGFSRYCVKGLTFHYLPTISTDFLGKLVFCYTDDGAHPLVGINELSNSNYPGLATLEACANSVSFAPWMPWSMKVTPDSDAKYMGVNGYYSSMNIVYPASSIRHNCFGSVTCVFNGTQGSSVVSIGELYWELDLEFWDPSPVDIALGIPLLREGRLALSASKATRRKIDVLNTRADRHLSRVEEKKSDLVKPCARAQGDTADMDCNEDIEVVSPPRYVAPPSTAPGTPAYRQVHPHPAASSPAAPALSGAARR